MNEESELLTMLEKCAEQCITTYSNLTWAETAWLVQRTPEAKIEIARCFEEHKKMSEKYHTIGKRLLDLDTTKN